MPHNAAAALPIRIQAFEVGLYLSKTTWRGGVELPGGEGSIKSCPDSSLLQREVGIG